jgi:membrane-associated phospholipid phosphatase
MYLYLILSPAVIYLLIAHQKNYWKECHEINLSLKREVTIVLFLIGLATLSIKLNEVNSSSISTFEMGSLSSSEINFFDRNFAGRWDLVAKDNGKLLKNVSTYIVPLSLLLVIGNIKNRLSLLFIFTQGYILTESITGIIKGLVNRFRPFAYRSLSDINSLSIDSKEKFMEDIVDTDITNSFFSGDASISTFGFIFFAFTYHLFYQDSKYKKLVSFLAVIGTILVCYFRVMSGKHFPTDVAIGAIVGILMAYLIIKIHKKNISTTIHPQQQ